MVDLIAQLEAATGPNLQLEWLVAGEPRFADGSENYNVPNCTYSLDAALALLLPFLSYELTLSAAGDGALRRCRLWDWRRSATGFDPGNEWKSEGNAPLPCHVVAAALKARKAHAKQK